jgi:hypothetical protein
MRSEALVIAICRFPIASSRCCSTGMRRQARDLGARRRGSLFPCGERDRQDSAQGSGRQRQPQVGPHDGRPCWHIGVGGEFASHGTTDHHSGEYVRDGGIYSNTAESYFAILKRGVYGSFHSISEAHMHRCLAEFDFRYSTRKITDVERAEPLIAGAQGKRLMYRNPDEATHA